MNLKVLFAVFVCLFSASVVCNVAMVMVSAPKALSCKAGQNVVHMGYVINNATEPTGFGDPTGGGWP